MNVGRAITISYLVIGGAEIGLSISGVATSWAGASGISAAVVGLVAMICGGYLAWDSIQDLIWEHDTASHAVKNDLLFHQTRQIDELKRIADGRGK